MISEVKLIALEYDNIRGEADLKLTSAGLLDSASGFETAVTISLFTWQRSTDANLTMHGQRFGWWGDTFSEAEGDEIGSQIWTLARERNSPEIRGRLAGYCKAALEWMRTDGIAESITVETERLSLQAIAVKVSILRVQGGRWSGIWEVHFNAIR